MQRKSLSLSLVALASLLVGCEWTSSSGSSSWSDSYDSMNFAGTYRIMRVTYISGSESEEREVSKSNWKTDGSASATGSVGEAVRAGTFSVEIGTVGTFHDDGSGTLVSDDINGTGKVTYGSGAWSVTFGVSPSAGHTITVRYQAADVGGSGGSSYTGIDTTQYDKTKVTAITVSQTGQYITMAFNNGVSMSGRFTSVRQTGEINEDTGAGANTYNAQFEVSGGSSKLVGTLNYDYPSHNRFLDGTWTYGNKVYDVHAIGPAWTESGATTLTTESN